MHERRDTGWEEAVLPGGNLQAIGQPVKLETSVVLRAAP